jgi:hypothetical protein
MNVLGAALEKAFATQTGGRSGQMRRAEIPQEWRGIGVLYAKDAGETVEFRVLYESHIPQEIKDFVAQLFGCGAIEWNVAPK